MNITNKDAVTRGEVVSELFDIIVLAIDFDTDLEALDYFVQNSLIRGRTDDGYQLDETCTTQEMLVFSVRVFEHISYELELDSKGLFWKITGDDLPNTVYLLGTMHIADSSVYPFSKEMIAAFEASVYLGVEANIYTMSAEDMAYMAELQMITDGSTIKDLISEETYATYVEVAESFGLTPDLYDYMKPWAAWLGIQQAMASDESADDATSAMLGIDMYFLMRAFYGGKSVIELESIRYQADMFESFSPELQEMLLLSVLPSSGDEDSEETYTQEELAQALREFNAYMLQAVKSGDVDTLTALLLASRDYSNALTSELNTKIWDDRDAGMAEMIEQYLAADDAIGDFFVAVGAGHTIGETGIVNVLMNKGYTVERVW